MTQMLGEFSSKQACEHAIGRLKERGIDDLEVYMPYPEKSMYHALGIKRSPLPRFVLAAGLCGAVLGYFILWFTNVHDFPLNVGGRPVHAVPSFIPITFETAILFAGTTAFVASLLLAGLPRFHHPLFEVEAFHKVTVDGWFLSVAGKDEKLDARTCRELLLELGARCVHEVGASGARITTSPPAPSGHDNEQATPTADNQTPGRSDRND